MWLSPAVIFLTRLPTSAPSTTAGIDSLPCRPRTSSSLHPHVQIRPSRVSAPVCRPPHTTSLMRCASSVGMRTSWYESRVSSSSSPSPSCPQSPLPTTSTTPLSAPVNRSSRERSRLATARSDPSGAFRFSAPPAVGAAAGGWLPPKTKPPVGADAAAGAPLPKVKPPAPAAGTKPPVAGGAAPLPKAKPPEAGAGALAPPKTKPPPVAPPPKPPAADEAPAPPANRAAKPLLLGFSSAADGGPLTMLPDASSLYLGAVLSTRIFSPVDSSMTSSYLSLRKSQPDCEGGGRWAGQEWQGTRVCGAGAASSARARGAPHTIL